MKIEVRSDEDKELLEKAYAILTCGTKKIFSGKAVHLKPGEALTNKWQIGIISTANPEHTPALLSAAKFNSILFSKVGGKLSHLALVGNELNSNGQDVCVLMVPYADLIDEGADVIVDLEKNRLEVLQNRCKSISQQGLLDFIYSKIPAGNKA